MVSLQTKVKKKRKKARKGFGKIFIILIISLYFLSRIFPILGTNSQKTVYTEYGKIENVIAVTGYIARDEKVFTNTGEGEVKYFVSEGEKVSKGEKLAEVYFENLDEKYVQDLEIINHRIENIENKKDEKPIFERDINKLDGEINVLLQKIQQDVQQGDYQHLSTNKKSLQELAEKQNVITGEKSFTGRSLSELQEQKSILEGKIKTSLQAIYSDYPGFIAFGNDGLEDVFNLISLESIKVSDLETIKKNVSKNNETKKDGNSTLRIINSHRWSIVSEVDTEKVEKIQVGRKMKLRKQGEEREYIAHVRRIVTEGEKSLLILDLTELMEGYYQTRAINLEIILDRYEGVLVPNNAIVEKDGKKGLYRVDINGFVSFLPVKVKGVNREFAILHEGTFDETNKETKETVKVNTIKLYDEIVLNGSKVSEGEKVK